MTPSNFTVVLNRIGDEIVHVRTVSGDLHTGMLTGPAVGLVCVEVENAGPVYSGMHKVWLAVEHIESIEEKT